MGNQIEIDESELVSLRNNSALLAAALANPKAREQVLRGLKIAKPDLPIPELDAAQPVMAELEKFGKTLKEIQDGIKADKEAGESAKALSKFQAEWSEGQQYAARQGYAGESLQALEKFMEDNGIVKHKIAIPAFEKENPLAKPVDNTSGKFDFFARRGDENDALQKKLWAGDPGYLDDAIGQTLRDIRGQAA